MKDELLIKVAENIDEDKSHSITAAEFFTYVIDNLHFTKWADSKG